MSRFLGEPHHTGKKPLVDVDVYVNVIDDSDAANCPSAGYMVAK